MKDRLILVRDLINSEYAEMPESGDEVFQMILSHAQDPETKITLSFEGVDVITTLFLHHSIAPLYSPNYMKLNLEHRLKYLTPNSLVRERIDNEIKGAKEYFLNPVLYEEAYASETNY